MYTVYMNIIKYIDIYILGVYGGGGVTKTLVHRQIYSTFCMKENPIFQPSRFSSALGRAQDMLTPPKVPRFVRKDQCSKEDLNINMYTLWKTSESTFLFRQLDCWFQGFQVDGH